MKRTKTNTKIKKKKKNSQAMFEKITKVIDTPHDYATI